MPNITISVPNDLYIQLKNEIGRYIAISKVCQDALYIELEVQEKCVILRKELRRKGRYKKPI